MKNTYFPMFFDISDWPILVIGGGSVGERRIKSLLSFGARITLISPTVTKELSEMTRTKEELCWIKDIFSDTYLKELSESRMVLAATDDRAVNEEIYRICRDKNILVNACHDKEKCDFYFPSLIEKDGIVIGINSGGEDPSLTKKMRKQIEEYL